MHAPGNILLCVLSLVSTSKAVNIGPTWLMAGFDFESDCQPGLMVADEQNLCWFWRCISLAHGKYKWTVEPQRCALGTHVPEANLQPSMHNMCTAMFKPGTRWDCTRMSRGQIEKVVVEDPWDNVKCLNGGTKIVQSGTCWCVCPTEWQGDADCSKPTRRLEQTTTTGTPSSPTPCKIERDYCSEAGGCLNNGTCINSCVGYWCKCPVPYTAGRRCEMFSCEKDNFCKNGGVCQRGRPDNDEYQVCQCLNGWTGLDCSIPAPTADPDLDTSESTDSGGLEIIFVMSNETANLNLTGDSLELVFVRDAP